MPVRTGFQPPPIGTFQAGVKGLCSRPHCLRCRLTIY
jgi:hypothetical protein